MRRNLAVLIFAPLLLAAEGDCGGGGDEEVFGGGGGAVGGDGGGDGGSTGGDGGGTGGDGGGTGGDGGGTGTGDDTFLSVSVGCEGDAMEYTWTYQAELSIQASYVTVEVDPGAADYEAWTLEPLDEAQTLWEVQVTELLSSRDCSRAAELHWSAFGFGSWEETYESTYSP
ncbi:hypothetical protein L6R53_15480 [Myxococcota bacterium]|nr:hypothetical protein [Myxococcota bacterium]